MTDFELALEDALELQAGGGSLDAILARYPKYANDLKPLLEAARVGRFGLMKDEPIPAPDLERGRERFLRAALRATPQERVATPALPFLRVAATAALVVVILTLAGVGLVSASESALPGDALYQAKLAFERIELALTFDSAQRESLQARFNALRRSEVQIVAAQGRQVQVRFDGVVERIDPASLTVSGLTIRAESGDYHVGDQVVIEARTTADGQIVAERILITFSPTAAPTGVRPTGQPTPLPAETRPVEPSPSPASPRQSQPATSLRPTPSPDLLRPTQTASSVRPIESRLTSTPTSTGTTPNARPTETPRQRP